MRSRSGSGYSAGIALCCLTAACFVDTTDDSSSGGDGVTGSPTSSVSATSGADAPDTDPGDVGSADGDTGMTSVATTATTSATNAVTTDPPTTAGTSADDTSGVDPGGGTIDVVLDGCEIDLGGTVVVSYNGSLGVASVYDDASLTGSFQFELDIGGPTDMQLSTQHRIDTGNVINMVEIEQGTWTNLDSNSLAGEPDRIGGVLAINEWEPAAGVADLEFYDVSLLNVGTDEVCTINGTIVTTELYP